MTIYYNQIPSYILPMSQEDDKLEIIFDQNPYTLNFLLTGKSGTGKSRFINILKGRKIAYESDFGNTKTNKINDYIISFNEKTLKNSRNKDSNIIEGNKINNDFDIDNCKKTCNINKEINNIFNNNDDNIIYNDDKNLIDNDSYDSIKDIKEKKEINISYQITDTAGFSEDNKESEKLLKCIKEYNEDSIGQKDRIQCILYFMKDSDRESH